MLFVLHQQVEVLVVDVVVVEAADGALLQRGERVVVSGLKAKPELNGRIGTIIETAAAGGCATASRSHDP